MKKYRIISTLVLLVLMVTLITACSCSNNAKSPSETATGSKTEKGWVPEKPIELLVTSSAGGGSDMFARTMTKIITDNNFCPVPITVVIKAGGGGSIGYSYLADKAGNPYHLAVTSSSYYTTPLTGGSPVSLKNFTHVVHMCKDPQVMVVNADSPYKTLEDIIEYAKANPNALNIGISNYASDDAIAGQILSDEAGVEFSFVPFTSGGEVLTNILGNHVDIAFLGPGECSEQTEAGKLIAIATSSDVRLDLMPDIPTFTEKGIDLTLQQSRGVIMPDGVPIEAVAFYENMFKKVYDSPEWADYVANTAMVSNYMNSEEYTDFSQKLNAIYAEYTKDLKNK